MPEVDQAGCGLTAETTEDGVRNGLAQLLALPPA